MLRLIYHWLRHYLRNKFILVTVAFFVWMLFFDRNDILSQIKLHLYVNELKAKKAYYQQKIEEVKQDEKDLFTNEKTIEKFAREKYRMKKEDEDIFIIVEEEE